MSKAVVRKASEGDVANLVTRIRAADKTEILKNSGSSPEDALNAAFQYSGPKKIFAVEESTKVLSLFGVYLIKNTGNERVGAPWMLCSDELFRKYRRRYIREYPIWIKELSEGYTLLENYVYAANEAHLKWIKWAGFDLVELIPDFGVGRVPFWRFQMRIKRKLSLRDSISKALRSRETM